MGGDASRLCDLSRSTVVFETVGAAQRCLETLQKDGQVLRVKNRFDLGYNAAPGGGYRDLSMNLGWPQDSGGVHVVELQLTLQSFFDLKSEGGHRRYIRARDLRGD